jgi:CIC family chloride channel protein
VAVFFIITLYKAEDLFDKIPIPQWLKPALGGLLLGLILIKFPEVFGVGYGAINEALFDRLPELFLIALVFLKIAATSITLGSGGSGGIFAPPFSLAPWPEGFSVGG